MSDTQPSQSFFLRHEFAIRRLHSLLGIIPLGAYMCVHLITNASLINGTATFQRAVIMIHSLGDVLPIVEWGFIFGPLLFHGILGVWIIKTGKSNTDRYKFTANKRYVWQRWTGVIALVFLLVHVLHLHGWFHFEPWLALIGKAGLGGFKPYNAASTLISQMDVLDFWIWPAFYLVGVLACVYHLANGLWTAGITWGLWISPEAQKRATKVCTAFGVLMAIAGLTAWYAAVAPGEAEVLEARKTEDTMYKAALDSGVAYDKPEKRWNGQAESTDGVEDDGKDLEADEAGNDAYEAAE